MSALGDEIKAMIAQEGPMTVEQYMELALGHADGTLLQAFQINWEVRNPHEVPWYASF